jgi:uncharacterized SAM-binding protein YcdF (DUF218 family)
MIPDILKGLLPGSFRFLLIALIFGTLLLYRGKDGGRAGRWWMTAVVLLYWILSTPATAVMLIRVFTSAYPPLESRAQAPGATAVVVLGAGMDVYLSRGDQFEAATRENALRMMEASRVYRVLDHPFVIVTGGAVSRRETEAALMASELETMGVPAERIVQEGRATSTHDHARYVRPLLADRHVGRFVLVTSRQHIDRALRVFQKAGFDPVPSVPDLGLAHYQPVEYFLPSKNALVASEELLYDKAALVYYRLRGWI